MITRKETPDPQPIPEDTRGELRLDYTGQRQCWCGNEKIRENPVCEECEQIRSELLNNGILLRNEALREYNKENTDVEQTE